jgi:hypothetical protein
MHRLSALFFAVPLVPLSAFGCGGDVSPATTGPGQPSMQGDAGGSIGNSSPANGSAVGAGDPFDGSPNGVESAFAEANTPDDVHVEARVPGICRTGVTVVNCTSSNGDGETCISGDPTQCPGSNVLVGAGTWTCQNACHPDEYGTGWGALGVGGEPPSGCRDLGPTPAGVGFACCPCSLDLDARAD